MTSINMVKVCLVASICLMNYAVTEMTEYLLAFPGTADPNVTQASDVKIYVTSESKTLTVNLLNSSNGVVRSVILDTNNKFREIVVPREYIMSGSELSQKALLLEAKEQFKAQVFNFDTSKSEIEGYLALPTDYLDTNYLVSSFCAYSGYCQVVVAARRAKTKVTITLPPLRDPQDIIYCMKGQPTPMQQSITVTLDRLEVLQIESKEDLTGTVINSSSQVAVFVGGRNISSSRPGSNIVEQLLPEQKWGTEFIVISKVSLAYSDVVHIQTREDDTKLEMTDLQTLTIQNRYETVVQRLTDTYSVFHIKANKPVQVMHYASVLRSKDPVDSKPSMSLVQAFQHWSKSYLFYCKGGANYTLITNSEDYLKNKNCVEKQAIWKTSLTACGVSSNSDTFNLTHQEKFGIMVGSCGQEGAAMLVGLDFSSSETDHTSSTTTPNCMKSRMAPGDGVDNDCDGEIDEEDCTRENEIRMILKPIDDSKVSASMSLTEVNVTGYAYLGFKLVSCGIFVVTFHGENGTNSSFATAMFSTSTVMFSKCKENCQTERTYDIPQNESHPNCNKESRSFWFSWSDGNITYDSSSDGFVNRKATIQLDVPVKKLSLSTMFDESQLTLTRIFQRTDCGRLQPGSTNLPDVFGTEFLFFAAGEEAVLSILTLEDDTDIFALDVERDSLVTCTKGSTCGEQLYADWHGVEKKDVKSIAFQPGSGLYQIFANKDVFVTIASRENLSSGMANTTYNIYPVDVLGNSYIAVAYCDSAVHTCSCQIATKSPATLHIVLTDELSGVSGEICNLSNTQITEKFSRFPIEPYKRYDFSCGLGKNITGVRFFATCNIAVFCGHYQQMVPVHTWGKEVYIPPIPLQSEDDSYQLKLLFVTSIGGNVVKVATDNYSSYVTLPYVGSYGNLSIIRNQVYRIRSNHSISVALIMHRASRPGALIFTLITPAEQYLAKNAFFSFYGTIPLFDKDLFESLEMITNFGFSVESKVSLNESLYDVPKVFGLHFALLQNNDTVLAIGTGTAFNDLAKADTCTVIRQQQFTDGKDNDCDGLLDEEICFVGQASYAEDYDLDGNMEEDCGCIMSAPDISPTATVIYSPPCTPVPSSSYSNLAECWTIDECPCSWLSYLNFTEEQKKVINEIAINQVSGEMSLTTEDLSASTRKLVSAKDNRPTAAAVGTIGIAFLVVVFGSIIALDIQSIIRDLRILGVSIRSFFVRE